MQTDAMLQKIQLALATDSEFIAWCVASLGQAPTIQIDFDEDAELDVDCYPAVIILAIKNDGNIRQQENVFTVKMMSAARKTDLTAANVAVTTDAGTVNVKTRTYTGRLHAEALREQASLAIYRARLGKVEISSEQLSHTYHPKFYSPFTVTIEERN